MDRLPECLPASDSSLLVRFGDVISADINHEVIALFRYLDKANPPWLVNLHPAYATLLIDFDPAVTTHAEVKAFIKVQAKVETKGTLREVPVRYNGPDLAFVAEAHGITPQQVIEIHSKADYLVAFLGFAPGFAYLLGLPAELATPRLDKPRAQVKAGSVGIGGQQTGIYPAASAGGWRLIGETDMALPPDWAMPGDQVRFVPV